MILRRESLFFFGLLMVLVLVPTATAWVRTTAIESVYIADAYYADLDNDGNQDDIKVLVEFAFLELDPTRVDLDIWITLPSGIVYSFRVSVYRAPSESLLNIDCIDMATESGWYLVTMRASVMGTGGGKIYITDQFEFDPPTGTGPGTPTVCAYF